MTVPLSILDLAPLVAGGTARAALRNSVDLVQHADRLGYHRYWVAEHHFTPGVASSQPALLLGQLAAVTSRIRLGSGAVQTGHQSATSIVEQFGMLDAFYPGRFDLGLGRSGQRRREILAEPAAPEPDSPARLVDGLLIPQPFSVARILASPRAALHAKLLHLPGAEPADFDDVVADVQTLLAGPYAGDGGTHARAVPGERADLQIWVLGSSAGQSARVAGARGLPFVANYHVSPGRMLQALAAYRAAFRPSAILDEPRVMVSADAVVAADDESARRLAAGFGLWVLGIRRGRGAQPYPSPAQAAAHGWTDDDRELVADRVDTQFVGSPAAVAQGLDTLRRVSGADELIVTTITHEHADRVRSYELLAKEWFG